MIVRTKFETMDLSEIYKDYITVKELSEKYYYTVHCQLKGAADAMLEALKNESASRTLKDLEREYNDNLIAESVKQIQNNTTEQNVYYHISAQKAMELGLIEKTDDIEDLETNGKETKGHIKNGFIVYTTDGGKTFLASSPNKWKYDMGVPVGYVINCSATNENDKYCTVTICATKAFRNMTLFGGKIDNIEEGYHFTSTLYEAGNDYNGIENTKHLYNSLDKKNCNRCALTTIVEDKIEGVDKNTIQWYIPSCGEIKDCFSTVTTYWLEKEVGVEKFYPILTSSMSSKDTMWVYGLSSKQPSLTTNVDWEYTLLPFANVKIENMYE